MLHFGDVLEEVQKHDIETFESMKVDNKAVSIAAKYLVENERNEMAEYLKQLAEDGLIRLGPLEGFLAAAVHLNEKDYILLSNKYDDYQSLNEQIISLVHEIGATSKFRQSQEENAILGMSITQWVKQGGVDRSAESLEEILVEETAEEKPEEVSSDELEEAPENIHEIQASLQSEEGISFDVPATENREEPSSNQGEDEGISFDIADDLAVNTEDEAPEQENNSQDSLESDDLLAPQEPASTADESTELPTDDVITQSVDKSESIEVEQKETPKKDEIKKEEKSSKSLVDTLLVEGIITREQFNDARDKQLGLKVPIQDLLISMGFVTEDDLMRVASTVFDLPVTKLSDEEIDQSFVKDIPFDWAKKWGVFPVRQEEKHFLLAMSDPQNMRVLGDVQSIMGCEIKPLLCSPSEITKCIDANYDSNDEVYSLISNAESDEDDENDIDIDESADDLIEDLVANEEGEVEEKEEFPDLPPQFEALLKEESPVVRLMNLILSDAVKSRASDIHIEPREKIIEVRYRIDGDLKNIMAIPREFQKKMVARVKILATLDITQTSIPQDGRIQLSLRKKKVDFRVSTIPTFHGEKVVARVLDATMAKSDLGSVGFDEDALKKFESAIKLPQGMVFVTGPTGSGKTSTLYAALNYIKDESTNIMTVEDPIEFVSAGINQIQVNPARGVTFAGALRSILRQDPNVILLGEIRDKETAEIAVKASLTGHLVLSTLHTNSAVETITRLADIGLEYYQIASSVVLIVSQRLMKVLCPDCKEEYEPDEEYKEKFKAEIAYANLTKFYRGKGCQKCGFTGFYGRVAVFEVLKVNQQMKDIISAGAPPEKMREEAKKSGMKSLVEVGLDKVVQGITVLDEVLKNLGTLEKGEEGAERKEGDEEVVAEDPKEQRTKPLILVVDDELDLLKIITKYLELGGYDVIEAHNGAEAIEMAVKQKPDLIITDLMMPVMDGIEETKILRSKLETAVIPIIMLTAKQDKETELKGLGAGADDYITKPFEREKLLARVKMLLKKK